MTVTDGDKAERIKQAIDSGGDKADVRKIIFEQEDEQAEQKLNDPEFRRASRVLRSLFLRKIPKRGPDDADSIMQIDEVMAIIADRESLPPRLQLFLHKLFAHYMQGDVESIDNVFADRGLTRTKRKTTQRKVASVATIIEDYVLNGSSIEGAIHTAASKHHRSEEQIKNYWRDSHTQLSGYIQFTLSQGTYALSPEQKNRLERLISKRPWYRTEFLGQTS